MKLEPTTYGLYYDTYDTVLHKSLLPIRTVLCICILFVDIYTLYFIVPQQSKDADSVNNVPYGWSNEKLKSTDREEMCTYDILYDTALDSGYRIQYGYGAVHSGSAQYSSTVYYYLKFMIYDIYRI